MPLLPSVRPTDSQSWTLGTWRVESKAGGPDFRRFTTQIDPEKDPWEIWIGVQDGQIAGSKEFDGPGILLLAFDKNRSGSHGLRLCWEAVNRLLACANFCAGLDTGEMRRWTKACKSHSPMLPVFTLLYSVADQHPDPDALFRAIRVLVSPKRTVSKKEPKKACPKRKPTKSQKHGRSRR